METTSSSQFLQRVCSRRQFLKSALLFLGGCAMPNQSIGRAKLPSVVPTTTPLPTVSPTAVLPTTPTPIPPTTQFSGEQAYQHAAAQMQFVPRHTGTDGWRQCGDYILATLAASGWTTEEQKFLYMSTDCRNLIGKRGSGPLLILGAHYDSRRRADRDPDPQKRTQPVPAANDGASGVAVLLELARVLKPEELNRTIWLVAFDAEDNGELDGWDWIAGSRHFVRVLTQAPQGMILFDMIGDADQQIYYEYHSHQHMNQSLWQVATDLHYSSFIPTYRHAMIDDHTPFLEAGIPAVDLIDFDYPYWHTTADTLDKVSIASLEAVGRTVEAWLLRGSPGLPPAKGGVTIHLPFVLVSHGCQSMVLIKESEA